MIPEPPYQRRASSRIAAKRGDSIPPALEAEAGPSQRTSATQELATKRKKNALKMAQAIDIVLETNETVASAAPMFKITELGLTTRQREELEVITKDLTQRESEDKEKEEAKAR